MKFLIFTSKRLAGFMMCKSHHTPSLLSNLSDMMNRSHSLYRLADKIDQSSFEQSFTPLYCQDGSLSKLEPLSVKPFAENCAA